MLLAVVEFSHSRNESRVDHTTCKHRVDIMSRSISHRSSVGTELFFKPTMQISANSSGDSWPSGIQMSHCLPAPRNEEPAHQSRWPVNVLCKFFLLTQSPNFSPPHQSARTVDYISVSKSSPEFKLSTLCSTHLSGHILHPAT